MNQHTKALAKLLQENGYRHHLHDVFRDFVELAACSIANAIDHQQAPAREERYLRTIGKYEKSDQERFPLMFSELVLALEEEPGDVLGQVFGMLEQGNAAAGQFFTPYHVCRLMADLTIGSADELRAAIDAKGYISLFEPAAGAGAMIIAYAQAMRAAGFNYQRHLHVTAVDVDPRAVHMAYLQLSLLGVPAVVVLGNTLTLEERERWYTPAHILGGWAWRLQRAEEATPEPVPEPVPEDVPKSSAPSAQLQLFGEAA